MTSLWRWISHSRKGLGKQVSGKVDEVQIDKKSLPCCEPLEVEHHNGANDRYPATLFTGETFCEDSFENFVTALRSGQILRETSRAIIFQQTSSHQFHHSPEEEDWSNIDIQQVAINFEFIFVFAYFYMASPNQSQWKH